MATRAVAPDYLADSRFGELTVDERLQRLPWRRRLVNAVGGFDEKEEARRKEDAPRINGASFPAAIYLNGEVAELFLNSFGDPLEL